jgi:hypothetical protein
METLLLQLHSNISILSFLISITLSVLIPFILSYFYSFLVDSYSNSQVAKSFLFITVTTFFVVFIVKSSITLSLGLVGALSIVRFRTPIKDSFELAMLFICIAVGTGLAVHAYLFVAIFTVTIIFCMILYIYFYKKNQLNSLFFNNSYNGILEIRSKKKLTISTVSRFFDENTNNFKIVSALSSYDEQCFIVLFNLENKILTYDLTNKAIENFIDCEIIFRENDE